MLLLAMMHGINNFFKHMDMLEAPEYTHLQKEIHCLLKAEKFPFAFRGKEMITLDMQL
jgi:hypothetical protein